MDANSGRHYSCGSGWQHLEIQGQFVSAKVKSKEVRLRIPQGSYRKWLYATHYGVHRQVNFTVIRLVLQPEGLGILDEATLVLSQASITQQQANMLQFLNRIGYSTGAKPAVPVASQSKETFTADLVGASHGEVSELTFCAFSQHMLTSLGREADGQANLHNEIEPTPLVAVRCDESLLKHFIEDVFGQK